ncbi:MAG: 1-acyl-sn-glycerol-3-phosphate acyltransferase [Chloroflexi bacterium]|nr:1-acyl-sn-glycerol-3-phosphate acyltransferase [Chloroflexota bacterium]
MAEATDLVYPRRWVIRKLLHTLANAALRSIADVSVIGRENLPKHGPLLVVSNHFSYLDPAIMISILPWPMEFLGGFRMPNAPMWATLFPRLWGYFAVHRGGNSRAALMAAQKVLKLGGIVGMYPEASASAAVLRSARPGAAFLALRSGVPVLPIGTTGVRDIFPRLRLFQRARVEFRIGAPIGPFNLVPDVPEREQMDALGHEIMQGIATLIPEERRGRYAASLALRAQAAAMDVYEYDHNPE